MASATDTARADHRQAPRRGIGASRLGRLIVVLNVVSLVILVAGALVMTELRRGLYDARKESLASQAHILAYYLAEASGDQAYPQLDLRYTVLILQKTFIPEGERARVFDAQGDMFADSYTVSESVAQSPLPPARAPGTAGPKIDPVKQKKTLARAKAELDHEVEQVIRTGTPVLEVRHSETGERVVSVSVPIQRVKAILGVLTLEAADVDKIIAAQRAALLPYAIIALGVTLLTSLMIQFFVARPILRLSAAADQVRLSRARAISLPDLEARSDEIGDLARSLETMTATLSDRMDAIERFAADVAHEIKNPLTSIRSAVETLGLVKDETAKNRLTALLKQDVQRLDRLITDISNASRLDAELSRESPRPVDLGRLLGEVVSLYNETARPGEPGVRLVSPKGGEALRVNGREGPIAQVFRNLIDNARSFSPPGSEVTVLLERSPADRRAVVRVEDNGPGIPSENLETVFQRFYTSRPKGAAFGGNSGLGLSIARQIIEAHSGRVWAENRTGPDGSVVGARFVVSLPEAGA
jgi:two-component system sensor histidine kinase ChvG